MVVRIVLGNRLPTMAGPLQRTEPRQHDQSDLLLQLLPHCSYCSSIHHDDRKTHGCRQALGKGRMEERTKGKKEKNY